MTPTRTMLVVAAAGIVLASGCSVTKPTPTVTVYNGGKSVHSAATAYCFDKGQDLVKSGGCRMASPTPPTIKVRPGDRVGINVDGPIQDTGWIAALGDCPLAPTAGPSNCQQLTNRETTSAGQITLGSLQNGTSTLSIFKVQEVGGQGLVPTGRWTFTLEQAS